MKAGTQAFAGDVALSILHRSLVGAVFLIYSKLMLLLRYKILPGYTE